MSRGDILKNVCRDYTHKPSIGTTWGQFKTCFTIDCQDCEENIKISNAGAHKANKTIQTTMLKFLKLLKNEVSKGH